MRSAKNIKLSCKSLKEKDDVILNRMPMRQNSISRRWFVICQVPAVRNEIHNLILLDGWLLGHWLPLYKHHAPKWKGRRRKIEIYMLTSYHVPPLDAKATCKWNEQKQFRHQREREWKKPTYKLTLAVTDVAQYFIPASKGGNFREYFHSLLLIV